MAKFYQSFPHYSLRSQTSAQISGKQALVSENGLSTDRLQRRKGSSNTRFMGMLSTLAVIFLLESTVKKVHANGKERLRHQALIGCVQTGISLTPLICVYRFNEWCWYVQ